MKARFLFFQLILDLKGRKINYTEDITEVSGKIKHALFAKFPRRRYITGNECYIWAWISHLPTIVGDYMRPSRLRPKTKI